ncbi:hypothetical protein [Pseudoclavibacter helvolus]|uniref:hypothetical protein n=1 Tax=Pseudoclavibacter helvolus TaxID=255205 RepID=UPI003735E6C5
MPSSKIENHVRYVKEQALFALFGLEIIGEGYERGRIPEPMDDATPLDILLKDSGIWFGIQIFVTACANVSKTLWPQPGDDFDKAESLREPLRDFLRIESDQNALRSKKLRNSFEHFDERLDRWVQTSKTGSFADRNVGPLDQFGFTGFGRKDVFRHFIPQDGEILFHGESFKMRPMADELARILGVIQQDEQSRFTNWPRD